MLAGLPFNLRHETVCVCRGQSSVIAIPHICQWLLKQYQPLNWERDTSFQLSGVSGVNVQRQVKLRGTWPGRCRFSRKPCPRQGQNPKVLWMLGSDGEGWSAVGSSAQTAGAAWFGTGLVWIEQGRDVNTAEKLCSLESVKRTFNFWALGLL